MLQKLADLLQKRKLTIGDLSSEEKKQFDRWKLILEDEVTVDNIVEFCQIQQGRIEAKWEDLDASKLKNERLLIMHTVYGKILRMIEGKKAERKSVEEELNRLLDE